jgi:hypothetical protein
MRRNDEEPETAKPAAKKAEPAEHMRVKSGLKVAPDGGMPVAFWEVDEDHPEGEVFVSGPGEFTVARTPGVLGAIAAKRLVEVK